MQEIVKEFGGYESKTKPPLLLIAAVLQGIKMCAGCCCFCGGLYAVGLAVIHIFIWQYGLKTDFPVFVFIGLSIPFLLIEIIDFLLPKFADELGSLIGTIAGVILGIFILTNVGLLAFKDCKFRAENAAHEFQTLYLQKNVPEGGTQ